MSYSYYEVYTNAQRAFSSLGFPYGADEDAAYIITWFELYNLKGIDLFCSFIATNDNEYKYKIDLFKNDRIIDLNNKEIISNIEEISNKVSIVKIIKVLSYLDSNIKKVKTFNLDRKLFMINSFSQLINY